MYLETRHSYLGKRDILFVMLDINISIYELDLYLHIHEIRFYFGTECALYCEHNKIGSCPKYIAIIPLRVGIRVARSLLKCYMCMLYLSYAL